MRNAVDEHHKSWYSEAVALAAEVGVEEKGPRVTCRQRHRNVPYQTISDYFK